MTAATVEAPLELRALWQRWRFPAIVVLVAVAVAVALAAIENAPPARPLDPRDASPVGARALSSLLQDRGVAVTPTSTLSSDIDDATVFVPDPRSLSRAELAALEDSTADVVVIAPGSRELAALAVRAHPTGVVEAHAVAPRCTVTVATTAGPVRYDGITYAPEEPLRSCYPSRGGAGMLADAQVEHFVVVLGSARLWTNEHLADEGNAALALGLLSRHERVVWLLPRLATNSAADRPHKGLFELLPDRLLWALLQLVVVVIALALWRGRRLGPVVVEPLPVVVPSAETVRGRARLLRAARARDAASDELRTATIRRLSDIVALGPDAPAAAVVDAVTARTDRRASDIEELLYGAEPRDDGALVALATALEDLESMVRGRR